MNSEDEDDFEDVWDSNCWPLRVIIRGDYEYTLVKNEVEVGMDDGSSEFVRGAWPRKKDGWESCPEQNSMPSPCDEAKRKEFLREEELWASGYVDDGKRSITDNDGIEWLKRRPRQKDCYDCECWYADLNAYSVYRRKKVT